MRMVSKIWSPSSVSNAFSPPTMSVICGTLFGGVLLRVHQASPFNWYMYITINQNQNINTAPNKCVCVCVNTYVLVRSFPAHSLIRLNPRHFGFSFASSLCVCVYMSVLGEYCFATDSVLLSLYASKQYDL